MNADTATTSALDTQTILDAMVGWEQVQEFLLAHSRDRRRVTPLGSEHEAMLVRAIRHPRERFRIMAASLGLDLPAVVDLACADRFGRVRQVAASSARLSPQWFALLADDHYPGVRLAVAHNASSPVEVAVRLLADDLPEVRRAAAGHDGLPEDVLFELARARDPEIRHAVALNPRSSGAALHRVYKRLRSSDRDTRLVLAQHPNTPLADLIDMTEDRSHEVNRELAVFRTEPDVLTALLADPQSSVRRQVLENPATPAAALEQLPLSLPIDLHELVIQHPGVSECLYERIVEHYLSMSSEFHRSLGVGLVRRHTSGRSGASPSGVSPDSPRQVLEALYRGGAREVLTACALDRQQPEWLRRHLIRDLVFTPDQYRALAEDPSDLIRRMVPDSRCPEDVLELLAGDSCEFVRGAVAVARSTRTASQR